MNVLVGAVLCVLAGSPGDPRALPKAFAPLDWSTGMAGVRKVFPGSRIETHELDDPKGVMAVVIGARTKVLGDVEVEVQGDRRGAIQFVVYSNRDPRPECALEGRDMADVPAHLDCTWRRGKRLLSVLEEWASLLKKELGAPTRSNSTPDGETYMGWQRTGYAVWLALNHNEDGSWEVAAGAKRAGWGQDAEE